jgi:hypothetical protein
MGGSASIVCGGSHIVDLDAKCWMLSVGGYMIMIGFFFVLHDS